MSRQFTFGMLLSKLKLKDGQTKRTTLKQKMKNTLFITYTYYDNQIVTWFRNINNIIADFLIMIDDQKLSKELVQKFIKILCQLYRT